MSSGESNIFWTLLMIGRLNHRVSFFRKMLEGLQVSLKKESYRYVFLLSLWSFQEYNCYRTAPVDWFLKFYGKVFESTLNTCVFIC